jgi:hypothetical protein
MLLVHAGLVNLMVTNGRYRVINQYCNCVKLAGMPAGLPNGQICRFVSSHRLFIDNERNVGIHTKGDDLIVLYLGLHLFNIDGLNIFNRFGSFC